MVTLGVAFPSSMLIFLVVIFFILPLELEEIFGLVCDASRLCCSTLAFSVLASLIWIFAFTAIDYLTVVNKSIHLNHSQEYEVNNYCLNHYSKNTLIKFALLNIKIYTL